MGGNGRIALHSPDKVSSRSRQNGRALIINGILASGAGVKMGDQVNLLTPTGEQTYTVAGIASDYLNAKTTTAYISQANIAADFGRTEGHGSNYHYNL